MLETLIAYIEPTIIAYGAFGVLLATLLEEIVAPIPSALVPLAAGFFLLPADTGFVAIVWQTLTLIALPVAGGITLGSSVVYSLGYWGGKPVIEKSKKWLGLSWADVESIEARLTRGQGDELALLVLRMIPVIPGVAISGFCGIVRYPFKTFVVITFFGALIRALMLGIVGWQVGSAYHTYSTAISKFEKIGLVVVVVSAALFLAIVFLKKRRAANQAPQQTETLP